MARTYRRINTRLRFEKGEPVPTVGDSWETRTALGGMRVRVHLLKIKRVFEHSHEPGVMLMDAYVSTSRVPSGD